MKVSTFFNILNKKIEKYDKMTINPFEVSHPVVLIWIDSVEDELQKDEIE